MIKKKNGFLTFCFSLVPGAGEMYMGFMKQGISIMAAFWLLLALTTFLDIGPLLFFIPLLWCYSFFNVHNLRGLPDEEFYAQEDDYAFHLSRVLPMEKWGKAQSGVVAGILIFVGACLLWSNARGYLYWILPDEAVWILLDSVPQIVFGVLLILCGICLIRGKKKELDGQEKMEDGMEKTEDGQEKTEDGQEKMEDGMEKTGEGQGEWK